jgi:tetratricopeptide (TPR) repeat protein
LRLIAVSSMAFAQDQTELPALYRLTFERAQASFSRNDYIAALDAYEAARAIAVRLADDKQTAACDRAIGLAHYRQGHVTEALEAYQRGLAPAEASGDRNVLAELWRGIGVAQRASGNRDAATAAAERSLALSRELGDLRAVAGMLGNLATLRGDAGDRRREGELLTESLHIADANHFDDMVRSAYDNLATMYLSQGDTAVGIDFLEKGLRLGEATHADSRILAGNLNNLAIAHESLGRYDAAAADFSRGLALARAAGDERRVATLLLNLAPLHRTVGSYPAALDDLKESGALFGKNHIAAGSIDVLANLAQVHLAMGDSARALDEGQQAAERSRTISEPRLLLRSLESIGEASLRLGQRDVARTAFREEVTVVEELRRRLSGGGQEGTFFLADKMNPYRGLIALEVEDGDAAEAFRIAEQANARQLLDVLRSGRVPVTKSMTVDEKDRDRRTRCLPGHALCRASGTPAAARRISAALCRGRRRVASRRQHCAHRIRRRQGPRVSVPAGQGRERRAGADRARAGRSSGCARA